MLGERGSTSQLSQIVLRVGLFWAAVGLPLGTALFVKTMGDTSA